MGPELAAEVLKTQGPMALALIIMSLLVLSLLTVVVAMVKWQSTNTVPLSVYNALCIGFDKMSASFDDLVLELVRRGVKP